LKNNEMNIEADQDVKAVIGFMQHNIPTSKLVGIAERLPELAKLLWGHYPQEPFAVMQLRADHPVSLKTVCEKQLVSTE